MGTPWPGHIAQSVADLTQEQRSRVRYPVQSHTSVSPSTDSRRAVVIYWQKYVHKVLINRLGGLSLPRKSVVRLTDCPNMTSAVYRGSNRTYGHLRFMAILLRETTLCSPVFCFPGQQNHYKLGSILNP